MSLSKPTKQFTDDDLITCGICHIEMEHPRSLLCLHTYCLGCLREWSKKKKDEVICPLCREPTPLPPDGVDGLRSNFFVTKLKDRKAVARQLVDKDVKIVCTSCDITDSNAAVARCFECDDFLCSGCVKIHKSVRVLRAHKIFTLDDLRSGKVNASDESKEECCTEHKGQVLWFFCKTCGAPICRDCTVVDHPVTSHELVKLHIAIVGQREEIQKLVGNCGDIQASIKTSLQTTRTSLDDLEQSCLEASTAIKEATENALSMLTQEIQKQCQSHQTEVSLLKSKKEKKLMECNEQLQMLECRLNSALKMANEVIVSGTDCDVASVYSHLTSTLKQLQQVTPTTIPKSISKCEFKAKELVVRALQLGNVVGSVWTSTNQWRLEREFGKTGQGKLENAKGLAITGEGSVAVADYDASRVYIYNYRDGRFQKAIDTTQSLRSNPKSYKSFPNNVVVSSDGKFLVADWTKFPTVYDTAGSYVRQIQPQYASSSNDFLTKGIALDSHGKAFLGSSESKILEIHNYLDGTLQSALDVPFPPIYITVSCGGNIIISADSSLGAKVIDSKGHTIHTLRPPADVTSTWCPAGMCTIGEGDEEEVSICNREGKPGVYRFLLSTGKYLGCLTTDLGCPQGVTSTEDGMLLVTDKTSVKVFAPSE